MGKVKIGFRLQHVNRKAIPEGTDGGDHGEFYCGRLVFYGLMICVQISRNQ